MSIDDSLLTPDNHALLLIGHQYLQLLSVQETVSSSMIDRTGLNSLDAQRVVDWVAATGKKKLVMAGLWTDVCLATQILSVLAAGCEIYIVTDAAGGSSPEAHERGVQRMIRAGSRPITALVYLRGFQHERKHEDTTTDVVNLAGAMSAASGTSDALDMTCWHPPGSRAGTRV